MKKNICRKAVAFLLAATLVFSQPAHLLAAGTAGNTVGSTEVPESDMDTKVTEVSDNGMGDGSVMESGAEKMAELSETEPGTDLHERPAQTESDAQAPGESESAFHDETVTEDEPEIPAETEKDTETGSGMTESELTDVSETESETETVGSELTDVSETESGMTEPELTDASGTESETETETIESELTDVSETETESETETDDGISVFGFSENALSRELSAARMAEKSGLGEILSSLESLTAGEDYIENEIVYYAENEQEAQEIAGSYGGELVSYTCGIAVARIQAEVTDAVRAAASVRTALPPVYPNLIYEICEDDGNMPALPDDPHYSRQWYMGSMNIPEAWEGTKGEGIKVAVIDTGISYSHEDLAGNVVGHESVLDYSEDAVNGIDDHSHGTHCAGIIAAEADNGKGIAGIAPRAQLYSVKVMNNSGRGDTAGIARGVIMAIGEGVDIISMSLSQITYDYVLGQSVSRAVDRGIVVVAASGNYGTDQKYYPAAYEDVIAVAAVANARNEDGTYQLADFSDYGSWIDIAAPGKNIYSTIPSGYGYKNGTSMACPAVAGVVALMLSYSPALRNNDTRTGVANIKNALLKGALPNGAKGCHDGAGYPLVDAETAVYTSDNRTPAVPAISFDAFNASDAKNVVLSGGEHYFELRTFTPHAKIYYTINGKKPTAGTGILYTGKIPMTQAGKVKIQAVAVLGDRASGVFSKTYTFQVKATGLKRSYLKEQMEIAKGKTLQLGVNIEPENVSSSKLAWSSSDTTKMIKVDQKGKVTCSKNASDGFSARITARTTDGTGLECTFTVIVKAGKTGKVTLDTTKLRMSHWTDVMWDKKGESICSTYQLKPTSITADGGYGTDQYIYKSSNKKVAIVDAQGTVTALGKGTATITVTANDGSGKKATCKVTVVTPVYSLAAASSTGFSDGETVPIGTGCSVTLKPVVNGGSKDYMTTPNNAKLKWISSDTSQVTVSQSGKVTCRKNAQPGKEVVVTAIAKDGYGCQMEVRFKIYDKVKKVVYIDDYGKVTNKNIVNSNLATGYSIDDPLLYGKVKVITMHGTDEYYKDFDFQTSDHNVVMRTKNTQSRTILLGTAPGKSKVTYTSKDGAKAKYTINFKVVY